MSRRFAILAAIGRATPRSLRPPLQHVRCRMVSLIRCAAARRPKAARCPGGPPLRRPLRCCRWPCRGRSRDRVAEDDDEAAPPELADAEGSNPYTAAAAASSAASAASAAATTSAAPTASVASTALASTASAASLFTASLFAASLFAASLASAASLFAASLFAAALLGSKLCAGTMCSSVFLVEHIESRQADVRHFLLTEDCRCGVLRRQIASRTN